MSERYGVRRAAASGAIVAVAVLAVGAPGCNFLDLDPLCCIDTTRVYIGGRGAGQYAAALDATNALTGLSVRTRDAVIEACQAIAVDLGASSAELARARENQGDDSTRAFCDLAARAIDAQARAKGPVAITFTPPICRISIADKATCRGLCAQGPCDIKARPPRCTGGKLRIACRGTCSAGGGADLACQGTCAGACRGSCTSEKGAPCHGSCQGTCEATAGGGRAPNGTCQGMRKGTCSALAPGASCEGTCEGTCGGLCRGTRDVAALCDGTCDGAFEPLACEGGKLEGGCEVDPKCEASCDMLASAKAECDAPQVSIDASPDVTPEHLATLRRHLPTLVVVARGRGATFVEAMVRTAIGLQTSVDPDKIGVKAGSCLELLAWQVAHGATTMDTAVKASEGVLARLDPGARSGRP